ncbi:MAG: regulatory protein RecX [Gemmatimonadetes bacterium]|nr:regulatory protein RecX [Gemmatimonadota bacterium]MYC69840.1 regulatory protein RecX [Gemmatimonadota bacterium]MYI60070.1 regulatory protein RecX [Gemmatimonadota bacterium]
MDDQLQKAKDAAYRYLSYRARSVAEMRDKLKEKDFAAEVVAEVVADLQRQQLLDDREFARRWVEARLPRAYGARRLAQDLRHKGVAAGVVEEVLAEYATALDSRERTVALLSKQAWRYRGLEPDKAKRRMLGFLARRGCDAEMARAAVEQVWQELANEVEGD